MTTQQTAIKYGVPMPETCEKLDWQGETLFGWKQQENGEWEITLGRKFAIPAPQMHEIAPLLPTVLGTKTGERVLTTKNNSLSYRFDTIPYNMDLIVGRINIINHHYAEAYAQMYLELKEANLL